MGSVDWQSGAEQSHEWQSAAECQMSGNDLKHVETSKEHKSGQIRFRRKKSVRGVETSAAEQSHEWQSAAECPMSG